jgi:hypothetical protein
MKRSTWVAVLVTAAVLVVAGNLPRLAPAGLAATWRAGVARSLAAWPHLERRAGAGVPAPRAAVQRAPVSTGQARHAFIAISPARLLATVAPPAAALRGFAARSWPALPPYAAVPAVAGGLAALLLITGFGIALRRDRRSRVWHLARRGVSLARIARTARVPQDAVRSLLTPGPGARR